jgi:ferredoxin
MRIVVEREKCAGFGMCEAMSHEFFRVGPDDYVELLDETPGEAHRGDVQAAVDSCPVLALSLEG